MRMTGLEHAIQSLRLAVERPIRGQTWRALVRRRLDAVGEALHRESERRGGDAWLAAREHHLILERDRLLVRIAALGRTVLEATDLAGLRSDLDRLITDVEHHQQRLNDLVYDSVSLELGGSE
ncbi:hypothetical protein [Nocardioides mesophilus]|uniref:Uncharacterized protein n=1 Tax=Nocardioides mesophilus TaxID=433659 RepID=A0A7G9RG21_9ACTN|nr:hypothetical protein [Nocardioides mesophilus]QNN54546.1 hypothetical protein H9L09_09685 [Nocardioides mesophilus]